MSGAIFLVGAFIIIFMMIRIFLKEEDEREAERRRLNPPNPVIRFDKAEGPWAYFANAISPRKFEHR